ncbi:MAG: hypothetical protein FGM52_00975 [Mycobacterium sp.]|nr:hypothetical protein [Mycobacterium sp.]
MQPGSEAPADEVQPGSEAPANEDRSAGEEPIEAERSGGEEPSNQSAPASDQPADGGELGQPDRLDAPAGDVAAATKSDPIQTSATTASSEQVSSYAQSIESTFSASSLSMGLTLSTPITQWNPGWISYSGYYQPIFANPYSTPMQVIYDYGGQAQTFTIPARQQVALDVPQPGVYSFTAKTGSASGPPSTVSVGSFSGGGYKPAPGQPAPPKPAVVKGQENVLVRVKFARGASEPFRVRSLTDLGTDPRVNGATKVLLDEEIPAWGQWTKSSNGEALFEITETQTTPGLQPPSQGPLPGYEVQLTAASGQNQSWLSRNAGLVVGAAVGAGVLGLVAVRLFAKRRSPESSSR